MENIGGGESGVMCCKLTEAKNVECIFFNFLSVNSSTNPSAKSSGSFVDRRILAGSLCNTSPRTRHNFCGLW